MANTKISALTANTNPSGSEEMVYALNNANGKMSLNTMKTFVENNLTGYATTADLTTGLATKQDTLVSGTNIRTINGASVVGSGDIIVTGGTGYTAGPGIDITGGVISATGGGVTELTADANIWELADGVYDTTYDLYYTSGNAVPVYNPLGTAKQRIQVVSEATGEKAYFVFNVGHNNTYTQSRCSFGFSKSSSEGECRRVREWDASLQEYAITPGQTDIDSIGSGGGLGFTQLIDDAEDNQSLRVSGTVYSGVTYTIIINSVKTAQTYSITLGTGVTNPLNITLPNLSNKKCVITLVATSASTAIVTGCTIES